MQNAFRVLEQIEIFGEIYTEINNDAAKDICPKTYYINLQGKIYNVKTHNFIPVYTTGVYPTVRLATIYQSRVSFALHRILMITFRFIPEYKNLQVNHIDGNKQNFDINNMEWTTLQGNNEHAQINNLICQGEHCPWSILTEKDVHEICQILQEKNYVTFTDIARMYNVSCQTITDIARGRSWKEISENYDIDYNARDRFTPEQVHKICQIFEENKDHSFQYVYHIILFYFGLDEDKRMMSRIRKLYNRDKNNYFEITSQYNY